MISPLSIRGWLILNRKSCNSSRSEQSCKNRSHVQSNLSSNRFSLLDPCSPFWCVKRFPQLVALLQIQPKISSIPKYGSQHQCCVSRDCTATDSQLIDGFSTDSHRFSQLPLSQRHGHEEFLGNYYFTDTDGLSFCDIHSLPHR